VSDRAAVAEGELVRELAPAVVVRDVALLPFLPGLAPGQSEGGVVEFLARVVKLVVEARLSAIIGDLHCGQAARIVGLGRVNVADESGQL